MIALKKGGFNVMKSFPRMVFFFKGKVSKLDEERTNLEVK
jgi:hypothetical protein